MQNIFLMGSVHTDCRQVNPLANFVVKFVERSLYLSFEIGAQVPMKLAIEKKRNGYRMSTKIAYPIPI
jgi:hypothetical protein